MNTWIPNLIRSVYRKALNRPASIQAAPSSGTLGDVDATLPPNIGASGVSAAASASIDSDVGGGVSASDRSGAATPVGEEGVVINRKQRRAEAKAQSRKKR